MRELSCTDKPCSWNKKYKLALNNYNPTALENHSCFSDEPPVSRENLKNLLMKNKNQTAIQDLSQSLNKEKTNPLISKNSSDVKQKPLAIN